MAIPKWVKMGWHKTIAYMKQPGTWTIEEIWGYAKVVGFMGLGAILSGGTINPLKLSSAALTKIGEFILGIGVWEIVLKPGFNKFVIERWNKEYDELQAQKNIVSALGSPDLSLAQNQAPAPTFLPSGSLSSSAVSSLSSSSLSSSAASSLSSSNSSSSAVSSLSSSSFSASASNAHSSALSSVMSSISSSSAMSSSSSTVASSASESVTLSGSTIPTSNPHNQGAAVTQPYLSFIIPVNQLTPEARENERRMLRGLLEEEGPSNGKGKGKVKGKGKGKRKNNDLELSENGNNPKKSKTAHW